MHKTTNNDIASSIEALRRNFFLVLGISIIVFIFSYGVAKKIPGTYSTHFSYMVSMDQKDVTPAFRYDGYYAVSAVALFSETLAGLTTSPEIIVAMFEEADVSIPTLNVLDLGRIILSKKAAPQLVQFSVQDASRVTSEKLATGLKKVIRKKIDEYNTQGISAVSFQATATDSWTSYNTVKPLPIASSLFMLVFIGGNMVVLFRDAMQRGVS